jgi:tetratricopeptide (TPR) repeat protein
LGSQAAFSPQSTPLNVEFSTKAVMKEKPKEEQPGARADAVPPPSAPPPVSAQGDRGDTTEKKIPAPPPAPPINAAPPLNKDTASRASGPPAAKEVSPPPVVPTSNAAVEQLPDPKQASDSLRRIRSQSSSVHADGARQPNARPAAGEPVKVQKAPREGKPAGGEKKAGGELQPPAQPGQTGLQAKAQSVAQTAASTVAAVAQSAAKKTSDVISSVGATSSQSTSLRRTNPGAMSLPPQLPPNGPSSVLVQASGLKPQSFGSKFRAGVIVLFILLGAGAYFVFRDNLLGARNWYESERNLVGAEEQSDRLIRQGEEFRKQGNYEPATGKFYAALELAPNNQLARFLLAQTYQAMGNQDEALKSYQALLRIAPEHLDARWHLAEIYHSRGNLQAAYVEYQRLIAFDQTSPQARQALEMIEKLQPELAAQEELALNARSKKDGKKFKKNGPELPSANVAALSTTPIVRIPSNPVASIQPPDSVTAPKDENPDPGALADTHKKLGVRYLNIREYRAAINEFLTALRMTPNDKDLYYFIGSSYNGLNQPGLAYDYYRRVDSGPYVGPAQSGAKQTEKAAREENKRRERSKNETGSTGSGIAIPSKPVSNSLN